MLMTATLFHGLTFLDAIKGMLEALEFKQLLFVCGEQLGDGAAAKLDAWFAAVDEDRSGVIEFGEFCRLSSSSAAPPRFILPAAAPFYAYSIVECTRFECLSFQGTP